MTASPPLPAMDHTGGHKDSQYRREIGWEIVRRMAEGQTVRQIAADPAMPSYATIYHWRKLHPDFARNWEAVRVALALARVRRWAAKAAPPPGAWRRGRKSSFTVELGEAVCAPLRRGAAMSAVTAMAGMPSAKVVGTWLRREPAFRAMVAEAREEGLSWLEWQAELAWEQGGPRWKDGEFELPTPDAMARAKAEVAYFEGRIGRLTPKVYGRGNL